MIHMISLVVLVGQTVLCRDVPFFSFAFSLFSCFFVCSEGLPTSFCSGGLSASFSLLFSSPPPYSGM